jgi:predicted transcriptional regulator
MYINVLLYTYVREIQPMESNDTILQIVGNETRRKILTILSKEPRYISEISKLLEVTQPAILKHLSILEKAGLIKSFWKKNPLGAARKYYRICDSVGVEVAINPKGFQVNRRPQRISCSNYLKAERTIKQLTEEVNRAKDMPTKAAQARELIKVADSLLSCVNYGEEKWDCETCHRMASLRREASQIVLHVSNGDIESGLRKLIDAIDQLAAGLQPARKR